MWKISIVVHSQLQDYNPRNPKWIASKEEGACFMNRFLILLFGILVSTIATAAPAVTELQLWHSMEGAPAVALQRLTTQFNASQQGYRVIPVFQGHYQDTFAAGMTAARAGKAPHMLQVYEVGAADMMATRNIFKPLYQLAAETRIPVDRENYFPPAAAFYSDATGRLLALPFNSSTPVMYYNRDAFREAGLDPDKPPRTWPELQPVLIALQAAGSDCPYTTSWQAWVHLENVSAWHNQPFASGNNGFAAGLVELNFNSHLMIRHISLLSAWSKSSLFIPAGRSNEGETRFAMGDCAILTGSSGASSSILDAAKFKVGMAPLPHYDDFNNAPYNTLIGGAALWAMAGKTALEYTGIARFMAFAASPVAAAEWHRGTGYIPVTRGAYTALQATGYYKEHPEAQIAATQLRGIKPGSFARGVRLRNYEKIRAVLDQELDAVWNGSKTPKTALDDAVERGNALLKSPPPSPQRCDRPGCR